MQQGMHYSPRHNSTYRPFPGDEHLVVKFFLDDRKNEKLTRERGYAVYENVEMVSINVPGDKQLTINAPANSSCTMPSGDQVRYCERFPEDYERFQSGQGAAITGLPLKHCPFLSKAEVSMLEAQNIYSVEQLSDMGGAPLRNLGPSGRKWQQQALAFLQTAEGSRDALADAEDKAAMKARIEALEAALERANTGEDDPRVALKDKIEELTGARPKGNPSVETLEKTLAELQPQGV